MTICLENPCLKTTQTIRAFGSIDRHQLIFRNQGRDKILRNRSYNKVQNRREKKKITKHTYKQQQKTKPPSNKMKPRLCWDKVRRIVEGKVNSLEGDFVSESHGRWVGEGLSCPVLALSPWSGRGTRSCLWALGHFPTPGLGWARGFLGPIDRKVCDSL